MPIYSAPQTIPLGHAQTLAGARASSQKHLYCWAGIALLSLFIPAISLATPADWQLFKQNFIQADGRVIDAGQGNISHSEGQGYAMLLATHHGDQAAFNHLWLWTKTNLQVRDDQLLSWRWTPGAGVTDKNNASDGDLLTAWALLRGYKKWHNPEYLQASRMIASDIRAKLLRRTPHGLILLPGAKGFDKAEGISINLSYWVFPAIDELSQADPAPDWQELAKTGMNILQYAHFGRWGLPPDWLLLTENVGPSNDLSKLFGYNAMRIPLYLIWSHRESPALLKPYQEFWGYFKGARFLPAWTDLKDDSVSSYDSSGGIHKLAQWILAPQNPPALRYSPGGEEGYYSSILLLLVDMAAQERTGHQ